MIAEGEFCDETGHRFYTRTWKPDNPKAVVYFLHGLGEHVGRYDHVFSQFSDAGIMVHAFDSRGYGKTIQLNGRTGDIGGYKILEHDVKAFIAAYPTDLPKFLVHLFQ